MYSQALVFLLAAGLAAALPKTSPCTTETSASTTTSSSPCPTICADYINECGTMYGGCFPDPTCTGGTAWPSFTRPPCPDITLLVSLPSTPPSGSVRPPPAKITKTITKTITMSDCLCKTTSTGTRCNVSICYDYVDACSQMYGGCTLAPECGGPVSPSWSKPYCSVRTAY